MNINILEHILFSFPLFYILIKHIFAAQFYFIMINLIGRKLPQLLFCTLGKFRAVQAIYQTILEGNIPLSEFSNVDRKEFQIYQQTPRTLLSDRIRDKLMELKESQVITIEQLRQFNEMIDPKQGINLTTISQTGQEDRFSFGQNISKKFPFKLNSSMANSILSFIYEPIFQNNIFSRIGLILKGKNVVHVVGTPGFGKSSTIFAIKYLNDIRIRHIIRNGCPRDSKITDNFKIFYFYAVISENQLKEIFLSEVSEDFGSIQELNKQMKLQTFLLKVKQLYQKKNIKILGFVDQVNALYNKPIEARIPYIKMWFDVYQHLIRRKPIFLVSSKNNPYQKKQNDPILFIAGSIGDQSFKKVNLDNLMTPESRICYTTECILFELEKYVVRSKAIEFIKQLKQVPFLTHLAVRQIIKDLVQDKKFGDFIKEVNNENYQIANKLIHQKIASNNDKQKLYENIKQMKQSNFQFQILMKAFFTITPSYKYIVRAVMKIKDENKNEHTIHRALGTVFRVLNQNRIKEIQSTAMLNYFFIGYGIKDKKKQIKIKDMKSQIKNIKSNQNFDKSEQGLMFNFNHDDYRKMQNNFFMCIPPHVRAQLEKSLPQSYQILVQYSKGTGFQNRICSAIQSNIEKSDNIYIKIDDLIFRHLEHFKTALSMDTDKYNQQVDAIEKYSEFILFEKLSQQQLKQKKLKNKKNCYVRAQEHSNSFDFILSSTDSQNKNIKLYFVDTTLKSSVLPKVEKFFQEMPANRNFIHLVKEISNKFESVQLCYYILRPNEQYYINQKIERIIKYQVDQQQFKDISNNIVTATYKLGHLITDFDVYQQNYQLVSLVENVIHELNLELEQDKQIKNINQNKNQIRNKNRNRNRNRNFPQIQNK